MAFDKLNSLKAQLERLPASLPNPPAQQSSYQWQLDQDFLSDEGIVAATNQMLERVMGMRANGITIRERGQGISGVVEVLHVALQEEPDNAIVTKWIDDITEAGKRLCPGENVSNAIDIDQAPGPATPADQPTQTEPSPSSAMGAMHKKSKSKKATPRIKENMLKTVPPAKKTPAQPAVKPSVPASSRNPSSHPEDVADPDYDPKTDITYDDPRYLNLTEPEIDRRYTFHVTDSHRRTFLIEGDESSAVSHTAEYISSIHQRIIKEIGPDRFVALLSDNTGNARKGWELTVEAWPHIFNLQDSVHEQQLTILEITKLPEFEELELQKLVNVLRPFAFSIKCLESAHSTPADVFIYWFGVMSEYEEMFSSNSDELKKKTILDIRAIINRRYLGMIKDGPSGDIYITSFFLEPRYRDAAALNQPDPLRRTLIFRRKSGNDNEDLLSSIPIPSALPEVLKGLEPEFASADLTRQLAAYAKRDYPFNLPITDSESPLTWWGKLQHHSQASLLAHCALKLLSICANSMADERTMSKVTKLNSHLRNRQEVQTLVDMIQIASYTNFDPEFPPPPRQPVLRWRDINKDLGALTHESSSSGKASSSKAERAQPSESDTESSEVSTAQSDTWLDGPRTTVQEGIEKNQFLGEDLVDIGSSVVRNLLSRKPIVVPVEEVNTEVSSIMRSAGTSHAKDPFAFLPGLK
ncbi:hypothetical protein FS837_010940 [Tulasnella sp. UAMH 9824]|nr:hypothetical protein FS837_010940 [Tulasnella sp. UAMH 9824]